MTWQSLQNVLEYERERSRKEKKKRKMLEWGDQMHRKKEPSGQIGNTKELCYNGETWTLAPSVWHLMNKWIQLKVKKVDTCKNAQIEKL